MSNILGHPVQSNTFFRGPSLGQARMERGLKREVEVEIDSNANSKKLQVDCADGEGSEGHKGRVKTKIKMLTFSKLAFSHQNF